LKTSKWLLLLLQLLRARARAEVLGLVRREQKETQPGREQRVNGKSRLLASECSAALGVRFLETSNEARQRQRRRRHRCRCGRRRLWCCELTMHV